MDLEAMILGVLLLTLAATPFLLGYQFAKWRFGRNRETRPAEWRMTTFPRASAQPALVSRLDTETTLPGRDQALATEIDALRNPDDEEEAK